ncbi:MAG: anti-sigma factor antagonist [Coriobacteriia bacterium]|nr:anti-sigma factor antagonist [Coriobacteriia bacterium]
MSIDIERQVDSRACVVRVEGEIDISVVPEMREALDAALQGGYVNVVIDLSGVTYADSSALGLLVWLDHRLSPRGGKLVLAGANSDVTRILELSGLISVAPSVSASPNLGSALEGLELREVPPEPLWTQTLDIPATTDNLAETRNRVVALLSPLDVAEASLFDIKVAVGEALANAVRHGSPRGQEDMISIEVSAAEDRITIRVTDAGEGFNGIAQCNRDVYASSGRGIMFMRALMDRVEFASCDDGGTMVTLVKHLPPQGVDR